MSRAGGDRIGIAVRTLRVDVDQAHLHGAEIAGKFAVARVAAVRRFAIGKPSFFSAPVHVVLRLPYIGAAAAEAEHRAAHRLNRDVAGEDEQIRPRELGAVLLLDRPQQTAGLVEVAVVRPRIQRRKTLLPTSTAAAAIADAVCAGGMPSHADKERAIMAKISRPPRLAVSHQRAEILDHCIEIEALEFLGVIKAFAHRVGFGRVLVQHAHVQLVRPPVHVLSAASVRHWAF